MFIPDVDHSYDFSYILTTHNVICIHYTINTQLRCPKLIYLIYKPKQRNFKGRLDGLGEMKKGINEERGGGGRKIDGGRQIGMDRWIGIY